MSIAYETIIRMYSAQINNLAVWNEIYKFQFELSYHQIHDTLIGSAEDLDHFIEDPPDDRELSSMALGLLRYISDQCYLRNCDSYEIFYERGEI